MKYSRQEKIRDLIAASVFHWMERENDWEVIEIKKKKKVLFQINVEAKMDKIH